MKKLITVMSMMLWASVVIAGPTIQQWSTTKGSKVLFVASPEIPMLDVRVVFAAGSARDAQQPGVAQLTSALLMSGAGNWNADQIASRLENIGAVVSTGADRDMATLSLRSLTDADQLKIALETASVILSKPTFPIADVERDKNRLLLGIKAKQQSPGDIAADAFYAAIYGTHAYASPEEGVAESVQKLKAKDLQAFHQQYYVAKNALVVLVGDVSRAQAEAIAEQLTQGLATGTKAAALPTVANKVANLEKRIAMPTAQTHILLGQAIVARNDPDYFALYVGNHILGGSGFASRLMQSIREDRGLAYSVYSYFAPMAVAGPFTAGMQTRNDQAEAAIALMREQIKKFVEQGPTEKELEKSIQNITSGFALRIDSNKERIGYLAMMGFYDVPLDYLNTFNEKIRAVTVTDIRDAFTRRVHPEQLALVIVGGAVTKPANK